MRHSLLSAGLLASNLVPGVSGFSFPQQSRLTKSPTTLFGVKDGDEPLIKVLNDMTNLSFLIYPYTDLRGLVKEGEIDEPDLLKLPITFAKIDEAIERNEEKLLKELDLDEDTIRTFDTFGKIAKRQKAEGQEGSSTLIAYDDKFKRRNLVYMVLVNDANKRVTVVFRGTNSLKDKLVDVSAWIQKTENRMYNKDKDTQPKEVRIHDGFHDYLFEDIRDKYKTEIESEGVVLDDDRSKFEVILKKYVIPALKENPGYELHVTGHSLGAALATLFAMRASALDNDLIPKPVKCFAIASPFVGALNYRKSVQLAEKMGLLRILRVSGQADIINCLPFLSLSLRPSALNALARGPLLPFKHVGLNLKLGPLGPNVGYKFMYPKESNMQERFTETSLLTNLDAPQNLLPNHMNYPDRIEALMDDPYLNSITLEELYQDKSIVDMN